MTAMGFRMPAPDKIWSTNEQSHWSKIAARRVAWRNAAWAHANNMKREVLRTHPDTKFPLGRCEVQVRLCFKTQRRRDPSNYVGTVVKSIVDGLVDAGLWPDDTPEYVTVAEPTCHTPAWEDPALPAQPMVIVTITPKETA